MKVNSLHEPDWGKFFTNIEKVGNGLRLFDKSIDAVLYSALSFELENLGKN